MKIKEFNNLNLIAGQKVKVSFIPYLKKEVKSLIYEVKCIEYKVLAPNKKVKCLQSVDGGFLRVNDILKVEILN